MGDLRAVSPLTRELANAIGVCAAELQQPVSGLTVAHFKKWLAERHSVSKERMTEITAHLQQVGGFNAVRDSFFPATTTPRLEEKAELASVAKTQRKAVTALTHESLFLKQFEETMCRVMQHGFIAPAKYGVKKPSGKTERILNLLLSDMHFGSKLNADESLWEYGFTEEARRLGSIVRRVLQYKQDHRKETKLVVNIGGDIIEGRMHDKAAGYEVALQVADATWLLVQALRIFGNEFKEVEVNCVSGNHDRSPDRHHKPATTGKWDSEATKVYYAVKIALSDYKNVTVNIPRTPFYIYEAFGRRVYVTHGDNNLNPGNVGSRLDVKSMETQINSINIGFQQRGERPIDLFVLGHVHVGTVIHLPMADIITNGALSPQGAYGLSIGYYGNACGQSMWESVEGHVLGDYRFLTVDPSIDRDESLDSFLKPFSGL